MNGFVTTNIYSFSMLFGDEHLTGDIEGDFVAAGVESFLKRGFGGSG